MTDLCFVIVAPEVSTNSQLFTRIVAGDMLQLECNYVGVPAASVTWTLNGNELTSSINSDITISAATTTGSSITTVLTWTNVPVDAKGIYYCILINVVGSGNRSFNIDISESEGMGTPFIYPSKPV